ncbi:MAG: hypothetical protein GMKNLPBB_02152 [Myxococcota bacterium]|nr:hypothetical protein [Myxococcota bacterium]
MHNTGLSIRAAILPSVLIPALVFSGCSSESTADGGVSDASGAADFGPAKDAAAGGDIAPAPDGSPGDAAADSAMGDAEPVDGGPQPDTGPTDGPQPDASPEDAAPADAAPQDGGPADVPPADSGDAGAVDAGPPNRSPRPDELKITNVSTGFDTIWEIVFINPGEMLVTERGGRVSRVALASGAKTVLGTIQVREVSESGLMGLALSPSFAADNLIYVCYTYAPAGNPNGFVNRISRFSVADGKLAGEQILVDNMPGSPTHDGCRLAFGPDGFLYATMGDAQNTSLPQRGDNLTGKVLRVTADGAGAPGNGFQDGRVFTIGHRNPQGLAFHPVTGAPYISEHGPSDNDEINLLIGGKNYGWPIVKGVSNDPNYEPALIAWTPTIAPAGMIFYTGDHIPAWKNDLLMVTLKERDLRRIRLAAPGYNKVEGEEILLNNRMDRIRAIVQGPDGHIYLGTSAKDGRGSPGPDDDRIVRVTWNPG